MPPFYELHSHLYGCLNLQDLHWLAARYPPRWEIFTRSYSNLYGKEADIANLFSSKEQDQERLASYYYFQNKSGFPAFQNCFDLVIALAHTDCEELKEICMRVGQREDASYAEYRMMFSPLLNDKEFIEKSLALCEGFALAEEACSYKKTFRLILSLSREQIHFQRQYKLIKEKLQKEDLACKFLVGIDFCGQEEMFPPIEKESFCRKLLKDNCTESSKALALLYHVGESYSDKSVESAIRWIVQSARMGAHRLGHAIALGIPPEFYLGQKRKENIEERLAQIIFEIENSSSLETIGYKVDIEAMEREKQTLLKRKEEKGKEQPWVLYQYNKKAIERLRLFQEWAMEEEIKKRNVVIESCPTSNLKICALRSPKNHPLLRFLQRGLNVVIGSDDPGIFGTSLKGEYQRIQSWPGITKEMIDKLMKNAEASTAKKLAGQSEK